MVRSEPPPPHGSTAPLASDAAATRELEILIRSSIPIIVVETREEARVLAMMIALAPRLAAAHTPVFQWTITDGVRRIDMDFGRGPRHPGAPTEAIDLLKQIRAATKPGVYVLLDFHPYLADPVNVRMLRDIAQDYGRSARTIVLVSHRCELPPEIEHLSARVELAFPSAAERRAIVDEVVDDWRQARRTRVRVDAGATDRLVDALAGLSAENVRRIVRQVVFDDGALDDADVARALADKHALVNRSRVVHLEHDTARFADVGGLDRLKRWLEQRRGAFDGTAGHLDPPKGVLLLGVQGCGKSLVARAVAGLYRVPLLKLDAAALYDKWHGESERNLREALQVADAMSPCVLWIDEIEKAFATGDGDSGTSRRLLGAFLTWLAERKSRVFVAATANSIDELPPELVRKGRFDEIFFVDLPDAPTRAEILRIHAQRRSLALSREETDALAAQASGYSGAELEQAIVAATYHAHARGEQPAAAHVLHELRATRSLATVMAERVETLRAWAAGRTVPAH